MSLLPTWKNTKHCLHCLWKWSCLGIVTGKKICRDFCCFLLKLGSALFFFFFFFHQISALKKLWRMLSILSKKLFFVLKILIFKNFLLAFFFSSVSYCSKRWLKINPEVYNINLLNKKHIVWYLGKETTSDNRTWSIDRVFSKKYFSRKSLQNMCSKI